MPLVALALAGVLVTGCGGDGGDTSDPSAPAGSTTTATGVSTDVIGEDEAVEIAREHVRGDEPDFDFDATFSVVRDGGETYEISFPRREPGAIGGEPHVVVDKATGEVVDSWYTL